MYFLTFKENMVFQKRKLLDYLMGIQTLYRFMGFINKKGEKMTKIMDSIKTWGTTPMTLYYA